MKPQFSEKFIDDLLSDADLEAFRAASLQCGLTLVKRRRQRRLLTRLSINLVIPLLLALAIWNYRPMAPAPAPATASVNPPIQAVSKVRLIKDDDLFALFPNRPLAIIGSPGHRKVVFLDQPPSAN